MKEDRDEKLLVELGARIKYLRKARNMSQYQLAIFSGMEKSSMSRIEAGKNNLTLLTLNTIALALEVSLAEIFEIPLPGTTSNSDPSELNK